MRSPRTGGREGGRERGEGLSDGGASSDVSGFSAPLGCGVIYVSLVCCEFCVCVCVCGEEVCVRVVCVFGSG